MNILKIFHFTGQEFLLFLHIVFIGQGSIGLATPTQNVTSYPISSPESTASNTIPVSEALVNTLNTTWNTSQVTSFPSSVAVNSESNHSNPRLNHTDGWTQAGTGATARNTSEIDGAEQFDANPYDIMNQGLVSKQQYEIASLVINVILKPIVCSVGVTLNIIGVLVLLLKNLRRSTYTYLCFLALSDVGYLLCGLIASIPKIINLHDVILANYIEMQIFPYITMFFDFVFTRLSVLIICALSVGRLVAVLRPLRVRELFLSRHALPICIILSLFCLLIHIHNLFVYYPKPYFNPVLNATMYAVGRYSWYQTSIYQPINLNLNDVVNIYIPPVLLITCNIGILVKVYQVKRNRSKLFAGDVDIKTGQDQRRMTLTLLIISLFFLCVFIPVIAVILLSRYDDHVKAYGREHYFLFLMADVTSLAWSMSSANDFIVYIYTSKQFRQTLLKLFCKENAKQKYKTSDVQSSDRAPSTNHI